MLKNFLRAATCIIALTLNASAQDSGIITVNNDIQLYPVTDSVFVHTTWHQTKNFGRIPSNGLVIISNGKAILVDTPMDNEKTKQLTEYIETNLKCRVQQLIIGHYHDDCLGGLEYLQTKNIESIANVLTLEKCKELNLPLPSFTFKDSLLIDFEGKKIVCKFFGPGHSMDNIAVWIPKDKILFGGCLVKSKYAENLGYTGESVIDDWDKTIEKILKTYPEIEIIIPGHGKSGGIELLDHTIKLVQKQKREHNVNI